MERRSLHDELKALATGTLSSEEEARLRERCAADPELSRALEDYLEVHSLTDLPGTGAPPCRVEFEEVEGALASRRVRRTVLRRYWRAAAAVLVLVGSAVAINQWIVVRSDGEGSGREAGALVLASIPLETLAVAEEEEAKLPALLESYRPVTEGKIQWIDSFDKARVVARLSSRPVLLFMHHPTCPLCASMKKDVFEDPDVVSLMARYVPAMSNVMEERPSLTGEKVRGWPWFGVVDADNAVVLAFPGMQTPGDFAERLTRAAELVGPSVMTWERMNDLASRIDAARKAEEAGRSGEAFSTWSALEKEGGLGVFGPPARNGSRRLAQAARRALVRARDLARSPPGAPAALAELEKAIGQFGGSTLGEDLTAVRHRIQETGKFPEIRGF